MRSAKQRPAPTSQPIDNSLRDLTEFPVVGIGASAGGLDACKRLLDALPAKCAMAFILVQHLDPTHESMMVDLLVSHTSMVVRQAADGMAIEREHLYVIPPGSYLSVGEGVLRLSQPQARHGARMPFDFLLHSLAAAFGARAIGVVLSGTGADGALGLKSVRAAGGLAIAQDPDEAGYDGMPRSAIDAGATDLVLPAAKIAETLVNYDKRMAWVRGQDSARPEDSTPEWLPTIIEILRVNTAHDFSLYKRGTLQRRIERRVAMSMIAIDDMDRYLDILRVDKNELDLLSKDLLINVTSFFRDPLTFERLAEQTIPALVRGHAHDHALRVWTVGCSTGEEAYSLAMLFRERIAKDNSAVKLQIFASDVDPDAIVLAREGLYPRTIEGEVSPERLTRFFVKEEGGYRTSPELRATVIFTVQDLLTDPPFSRLDMISCRNFLIYLLPEAQAKAVALFHFALREGGILLLGGSETLGAEDGRFETIAKSDRLYRNIGRSRPMDIPVLAGAAAGSPASQRRPHERAQFRPTALAETCRRLVLENFAPAAVLINRRHECLYSLGPIDNYLKVAPGHPAHDILSIAREGVRARLRATIERAFKENVRVRDAVGAMTRDGGARAFSIAVEPVRSDGEDLLLICFIDEPLREATTAGAPSLVGAPRVAELELELEATRAELQGAIRNLEISSEEQRAISEEARSVGEEYQATNEELLASKEELQSLNEELTALNGQLRETLERQRTTSNDLQNVLYSTDIATLFLDARLKIRFFTPATRLLFSVIAGDIGRPLADLSSLAVDGALLTDARDVLRLGEPIEREIEAGTGAWYMRRIQAYRTDEDEIEGVVITFVDITERRQINEALNAAERQAMLANAAKSRFLAAASHDLRQPLQTLALVQGLLGKIVEGDRAHKLVARLDETLGAMSGMLNALLDINQIESGSVHAELVDFPIDDALERLKGEFAYLAQARKLELRTAPCSLIVHSDPRLLEQMLRNLIANALKYTKSGKVLMGCRRHRGMLSIEVWDTGIGIPEQELQAIFEEYHQVDNAARERSQGLGLGLAIVQRLAILLGHRVRVHSRPGKGSHFAIEVALPTIGTAPKREGGRRGMDDATVDGAHRSGSVLIVEDDPEVRELLALLLKDEGHHPTTASDGPAALELVARGVVLPDLILADYNLPNGMDGLELAAKLREKLQRQVPVIILTGDISALAPRDIPLQDCLKLNKPVKTTELMHIIQRLLPIAIPAARVRAAPSTEALGASASPLVYIVDDDPNIREAIRGVLEEDKRRVEDFESCEAFLEAYRPGGEACLLIDAYLPGMSGLELVRKLTEVGDRLPAIMITGDSDVSTAVEAMKSGAVDFIEKPVSAADLLASVARALERSHGTSELSAWRKRSADQVAALTSRQREIMDLVLAGHPSKNIAADLGISQRTVENHRAEIMKRTGSKSLPALARLALAATANDAEHAPAAL